jgi:hypothetical protein
MFVSLFRYKKLLSLRNEEFMSFSREIYELNSQISDAAKETDKYKKLYADELQKRLELAEHMKKMEDIKCLK